MVCYDAIILQFVHNLIFRVASLMANVVGQSCAEKAILSNQRYTAEEALAIGMVDKVVPKDKVMEETKSELEKWVAFSGRTGFVNYFYFGLWLNRPYA